MPATQSKQEMPRATNNTTSPSPTATSTTPNKQTAPQKLHRTLLSRFQGAFFLLLLLVCGLYICCIILPIFLLLLPLHVSLAQRILDFFVAAYLALPPALLELYGTRIHCYGDAPSAGERGEYSVMVCNHPTELDWMYLWHWMYRYSDLTQLKIVMKGGLRRAPIIGWALQLACHLFLAREWDKDQKHVQRLITHYRRAMQPTSPIVRTLFDRLLGRPSLQLLIFPEGTNMRPAANERSDQFATAHNLPLYTHVLHPRTTGFVYIMDQLTGAEAEAGVGEGARLRAVYDMTVAFPGTQCANIKQLVLGYLPSDISFYCKRFPIDSLPTSPTSTTTASTTTQSKPKSTEKPSDVSATAPLALWLERRYQAKEAQLAAFHNSGNGRLAEGGERGEELGGLDGVGWVVMRVIVVCWCVFAVLMVWMSVVWSAWRWYVLACVLAFTAVSWRGGGDALVLWLEQRVLSAGGGSVAQKKRQSKKVR